eukprot:gene46462-56897_t
MAAPTGGMFDLSLLALSPPGWGGVLLVGFLHSLQLAFGGYILGILIGVGGAFGKLYGGPILKDLLEVYTTVIRAVPDLVLILLIFYGGQQVVNMVAPLVGYEDYIDLDPFWSGVFTLGFIFGAYLSETFRGAFMAIQKGQGEAGFAYGMSGRQVFFRVLVPQMIRLAIPGFTNNWLVLTKATALETATTGITAKSPYMLRTSMTMHQMTGPFGTWTAKNKIGKVYTLVSDYSTGLDAEANFSKEFGAGGGKVVGSARVPLANPDYSPFIQRIKDEKPDALFFFAPGVEDGVGLLKAFSDKGLDKAGIKFLGVGDMTSETPTLEALGDRALGAVTVLNYAPTLDNETNKAFLKAYAAANPGRPPATF